MVVVVDAAIAERTKTAKNKEHSAMRKHSNTLKLRQARRCVMSDGH